jgi:hypothetical protein
MLTKHGLLLGDSACHHLDLLPQLLNLLRPHLLRRPSKSPAAAPFLTTSHGGDLSQPVTKGSPLRFPCTVRQPWQAEGGPEPEGLVRLPHHRLREPLNLVTQARLDLLKFTCSNPDGHCPSLKLPCLWYLSCNDPLPHPHPYPLFVSSKKFTAGLEIRGEGRGGGRGGGPK